MSAFNPFAAAGSAMPVSAPSVSNIDNIHFGPGCDGSAPGGGYSITKKALATPTLSFVNIKHGKQKYVEIAIRSTGSYIPAGGSPPHTAGVGITFGDMAITRRDRMPGWDAGTIALHADDGSIYDGAETVESAVKVTHPCFNVGTVMGVGILPAAVITAAPPMPPAITPWGTPIPAKPSAASAVASNAHELIFTVNGSIVKSRTLAADKSLIDAMHLAVGLWGVNVTVDVNGGEHPFRYAPANAGRPVQPVPVKPSAGPSSELIRAIMSMPSNSTVSSHCSKAKIGCMSVAWEDTGRTKGSCFGPNISDMTLNVKDSNMPIFRLPNFSDKTSDQPLDSFWLKVGNEVDGALTSVTLRDYLTNIKQYLGKSASSEQLSLLEPSRDSKILTSAQACVLPLADGKVEFNVALYNYQSSREPAVLVIVASSQGTSAQICMGRKELLRFNKNGNDAADFIAERLSDDRAARGVPLDGPMTEDEKKRNCLLIFQVPLKVTPPPMRSGGVSFGGGYSGPCPPCSSSSGAGGGFGAPTMSCSSSMAKSSLSVPRSRGIEAAMLSTTEARGEFKGVQNKKLERDTTMPIRCTFQYYHVTDTAQLNADVVSAIAGQVTELYDAAAPWNRGSLVTGGSTGRITEHTSTESFGSSIGIPQYPFSWGFRS